jgi:hypothetical protein
VRGTVTAVSNLWCQAAQRVSESPSPLNEALARAVLVDADVQTRDLLYRRSDLPLNVALDALQHERDPDLAAVLAARHVGIVEAAAAHRSAFVRAAALANPACTPALATTIIGSLPQRGPLQLRAQLQRPSRVGNLLAAANPQVQALLIEHASDAALPSTVGQLHLDDPTVTDALGARLAGSRTSVQVATVAQLAAMIDVPAGWATLLGMLQTSGTTGAALAAWWRDPAPTADPVVVPIAERHAGSGRSARHLHVLAQDRHHAGAVLANPHRDRDALLGALATLRAARDSAPVRAWLSGDGAPALFDLELAAAALGALTRWGQTNRRTVIERIDDAAVLAGLLAHTTATDHRHIATNPACTVEVATRLQTGVALVNFHDPVSLWQHLLERCGHDQMELVRGLADDFDDQPLEVLIDVAARLARD